MSSVDNQRLSADRDRLIHILVVHFDMFRHKAEEAADLFLHDKTLRASATEVEPAGEWSTLDHLPAITSGYYYAEGPGDLRIRTNDKPLRDRILMLLAAAPAQPSLVDGEAADTIEALRARLLAAEKERDELADHLEQSVELLEIIKEHWIDYDHVFSIAVHEAKSTLSTLRAQGITKPDDGREPDHGNS